MAPVTMRTMEYLQGIVACTLLLFPVLPRAQVAEETIEVEEAVIVGSRSGERTATDAPVPVDVFAEEDFLAQSGSDLTSSLAILVPSFNVSTHPISGGGTFVRPANLRGLPPDSTLVLINGKRRHRASMVTFLGGGLADGAQGPDLQSIPSIALERVEILRDGASAQYGSDAVAGVINLVLRDQDHGGSAEMRWGRFHEGDGASWTVAANAGMPLVEPGRGFANFSVEYGRTQATSRSVQRQDAQNTIDADRDHISPFIRVPHTQVWGQPDVAHDFRFFGNLGLDLGESAELYLMPSHAYRESEGGFYFRHPTRRRGVFRDADNDRLLVADLRDAPDPSTVPVVRLEADGTPDPEDLEMVATRDEFYSYNERLPGGFTPQFGATIDDMAIAGGVRGRLENLWHYDAGAAIGRHRTVFHIRDTVNAQLLAHPDFIDDPGSFPTDFDPGNYIETDYTLNFETGRAFEMAWFPGPVNLSTGLEYRVEEFELEAGEEYSWWRDDRPGGLVDQGFSVGSNGWPGFRPRNASLTDRGSHAAWVDVESEVRNDLLLGAAVRYENFEGSIGSTLNGKFTSRWQVVESLALRASVSTGFRAPSVGQSNIRREGTTFVTQPDGTVRLVDTATLPPDALNALGVTVPEGIPGAGGPLPLLEPETSVNLGLGAIWSFRDLDLTLDYYRIEVSDRISLTDTIDYPEGIPNPFNLAKYRYLSNYFDSVTQGVDIVASHPFDSALGRTTLTLAANFGSTRVDRGSIVDERAITAKRIDQLENSIPDVRGTLTVSHVRDAFDLLARLRYYDDFTAYNADSLRATSGARWLVDLEVGRTFGSGIRLAAGAENLLDTYPEAHPPDIAVASGALYPEYSPFGFNGGFYYLRASYSF